MSATANVYEEIYGAQSTPAPPIDEVDAKLPRYVFLPFRDRKLRPQVMGEWGLSRLRAGVIQPIFEFDKNEIYFNAVKDTEENDLTATMGVTEMRLRRRLPLRVIEAMSRMYGFHDGISTGFGEIVPLRGYDRTQLSLILELQRFCLPIPANSDDHDPRATARQQIQYLDGLDFAGKPQVFYSVASSMMERTMFAQTWAEHHYVKVMEMVEAASGAGRVYRLSKLAKAVCAWIERPEPKAQSKLQQGQAPPIDLTSVITQAVAASVAAVSQMMQPKASEAKVAEPAKATDSETEEWAKVTDGVKKVPGKK